jgi:hypothetical protein
MKLLDVIMGEPEKKEFPYGNQKIVIRTLKQSELNEIMMRIPRIDATMLELEKIPTLARSMVSVNGMPIEMFEEVRELTEGSEKENTYSAIEKIMSKWDTNTIGLLYGLYQDFRLECYKKKEELKNNSQTSN